MNYCDKQQIKDFFDKVNTDGIEAVDGLYRYLVPILLTGLSVGHCQCIRYLLVLSLQTLFPSKGCLIGLILNVILLIAGHIWCRNKSPIFRLSLNLATTDAINSLIVGIGLFLNSYLPRVFGVGISKCSLLVFEIFRLSSLVASALHLLAMALVYYRGTTHPLHYRYVLYSGIESRSGMDYTSQKCFSKNLRVYYQQTCARYTDPQNFFSWGILAIPPCIPLL